jgi:subtilisin family serine protease
LAQVLPSPAAVPGLPRVELPVDVDRTVDTTQQTVNDSVAAIRRVRTDAVLRENRTRLERNPHGEVIVRNEVVAVSPTADALERAAAAGFSILRRRRIDALDLETVVLAAPQGASTSRALQRLRKLDPAGTYDFNHVYTGSGELPPGAAATAEPNRATGGDGLRLGLIDGGVDWQHPALARLPHDVWGCNGTTLASAHGTAVASLLADELNAGVNVTPSVLLAADVYCGVTGAAAVESIAAGFGWLAAQHAAVINVSLVGPPNRLLEQIVIRVIARGHLVVAAVGNDGPAAPPLYPAAYAGVVGVTAVDARQRVLLEAGRGTQVDFAARGADLVAATLHGDVVTVRGTSFASPLVAARLAREIDRPDPFAAKIAIERLAATAIDLGERGRDPIYGIGLVPTLSQVAADAARIPSTEENAEVSRMTQ